MKCPVSACALETEGAPTAKGKQPSPLPPQEFLEDIIVVPSRVFILTENGTMFSLSQPLVAYRPTLCYR